MQFHEEVNSSWTAFLCLTLAMRFISGSRCPIVSVAIINSSSVGMTTTFTFESSVEMIASLLRTLLRSGSSLTPKKPRVSQSSPASCCLVFTNTSGEQDYVNTTHSCSISTDVFRNAVEVDCFCTFCDFFSSCRSIFQFTHIA